MQILAMPFLGIVIVKTHTQKDVCKDIHHVLVYNGQTQKQLWVSINRVKDT